MSERVFEIVRLAVQSALDLAELLTGDRPSDDEVKAALQELAVNPPRKAQLPDEFRGGES